MDNNLYFGRNVLITGGAGFIGSNLALRLAHRGANVTVVDSMVPEYGGNVFNIAQSQSIRINIADVRDSHSMRYLIKNHTHLFNLAGQTSHLDSMKDPFTDLEINAQAQLAILEACRRHNPEIRVVFASTRQIYGKPHYLPVDERHPVRPVDVNGINKVAGESYHLLYHDVYGIRACALRLTNTYGPRMRIKDARQTFVGVWVRLLLDNTPFDVWGGSQLRDFNYVDDVVDALLTAGTCEELDGDAFNLGGHEVVTLRQLADILLEVNGKGAYRICDFPEERKKIDIGDFYADFSKFHAACGWRPKTGLREGLSHTLAYYRRHLEHYLPEAQPRHVLKSFSWHDERKSS
jgi:UDP-glucose 4-epimerase